MFPISFHLSTSIPVNYDAQQCADSILGSLEDFLYPYYIRELSYQDNCVIFDVPSVRLMWKQSFTPWLARCVIEVEAYDNTVGINYSAYLGKPLKFFVIALTVWFGGFMFLAIPAPLFQRLALIYLVVLAAWLWIYGAGYYTQSYIRARFFMRALRKWSIEQIEV